MLNNLYDNLDKDTQATENRYRKRQEQLHRARQDHFNSNNPRDKDGMTINQDDNIVDDIKDKD